MGDQAVHPGDAAESKMGDAGKGSFQQVIHLGSGGALDLTEGAWLPPDGKSIANKGIAPEIKARDNPNTKPDEALNKALSVLAETAAVQNR